MDYILAHSLSLFFYVITLAAYNQAIKEYAGEKTGAAIKLIMAALIILFIADFADYFFALIFSVSENTILIIKILLRLASFCVLFFGGLRFFIDEPVDNRFFRYTSSKSLSQESALQDNFAPDRSSELRAVLQEASRERPGVSGLRRYLANNKFPVVIPCVVIAAIIISYYLLWRTHTPKIAVDKKFHPQSFQPDNITKEQKQKIEAILAKIKQEQKREAEIFARIEQAEAKEREVLDRIEKKEDKQRNETKEEQTNDAEIKAEKEADKKRLAKIRKANERRQLAKIKQANNKALKLKEISIINRIMASAQKSLSRKKYSEAKNTYQTALGILETSSFKDQTEFLKYRIKIEKALRDEEIIFGSQGYIYYQGSWITPGEYDKKLSDAGFVIYKGKRKHFMELKDIIISLTKNKVKTYLTYIYSGKNIHKKNIRFNRLTLKRNSGAFSEFTIFYRWEVWTFSEIGEGVCSLDIRYDADQDKWKILRECEEG
jgi:hypothetical protein